MRKNFLLFFILPLLLFGQLYGQIVPEKYLPKKPSNYDEFILVRDEANMLSRDQRQALEKELRDFQNTTSNQILVVTVETLNGYQPYEVATEIIEKWGVGGAKNDNGVVLLISNGKKEENRRKVFIGTGRGLEGAITDGIAGTIVRNEITPSLKANDYFGGIVKGVKALQAAAKKEYNVKNTPTNLGSGIPLWAILIMLLVVLFIFSRMRRNVMKGGYGSRRGYRNVGPDIFWFPGMGGMGGGGGGGNSGGGFDMPDFGGFGGGSSAGGGAGGDW
jgi:uncharacterized protein